MSLFVWSKYLTKFCCNIYPFISHNSYIYLIIFIVSFKAEHWNLTWPIHCNSSLENDQTWTKQVHHLCRLPNIFNLKKLENSYHASREYHFKTLKEQPKTPNRVGKATPCEWWLPRLQMETRLWISLCFG